ncbi:MAG: ArsR/SmtB family transcription factor [Nanobdellota archaeon]
MKKNFLLLNLNDDEINDVANAVSNKTGKKILEYLAESKATESELAKKLNVAISTVHYNLQQLIKAGLVKADEYHYSKKGREILHYKLANEYIIIAPQKQNKKGLTDILKKMLPVMLITGGVAGVIKYLQKIPENVKSQPKLLAADSANSAYTAESSGRGVTSGSITDRLSDFLGNDIALWFFIGAVFALLMYGLIAWLYKKLK